MRKAVSVSLALVFLSGVSVYSRADNSNSDSAEWGVYSQLQVRISSAQQIAQIKSVKAAVKKADVPPSSDEAAMIRISMGVAPDVAHQPNDCCFDGRGGALSDRDVAERLAVEEVMRRSGIEPGSEEEAQLRAAAEGRVETADGEEVDQQTVEDMAKEIAKQQAAMYSGAQSGSSEEALIGLGVDTFWEKMKSWMD